MHPTYLSYDIRGIQKFIFAVPNLRCVIGASSLIAEFDHQIAQAYQSQLVYSGGGGGMLRISAADEQAVRKTLLAQAKLIGVDLRIGTGATFSQAKTNDTLYAFVPESLIGEPCSMSGLYPVDPDNPETQWRHVDPTVHALVGMRRTASKTDVLNNDLLSDLVRELAANGCDLSAYEPCFFRNVNVRSTEKHQQPNWGGDDDGDAAAGSAALGSRNRWAVIAMDGNDAGQQHLNAQKRVDAKHWTEAFRDQWVAEMSVALRDVTRRAFLRAAAAVVKQWLGSQTPPAQCLINQGAERPQRLILPLRPLVLGGDDVILLCHTAGAMTFVKVMADAFAELCEQAGSEWLQEHHEPLWPASGNRLTISAGVLFTKNTYPLHAAIQYAENLLGSAKGKFRQNCEQCDFPMPAAIDFDVVTDTLLDTPTERRRRELRFDDQDINEIVELTQRPYLLSRPISGWHDVPTLSELETLQEEVGRIPRSTLAAILAAMSQPWALRVQFMASLSQKHGQNHKQFNEEQIHKPGPGWQRRTEGERSVRRTSLVDTLLLLEEQRRDEQITTGVLENKA